MLLISAPFLTSPFIRKEEVPRLLERRTSEGIWVIPVLVKPCAWDAVDWLRTMQLYPRDARPLSAGDDHQVDADLAALVRQIHRHVLVRYRGVILTVAHYRGVLRGAVPKSWSMVRR